MHTVKVTIKSTFRKKTYSIAILAFFILTAILLLSYYHPDISVMEYLSFSMKLGQIGLSFFVFFCYEFLPHRPKSNYAFAAPVLMFFLAQVLIF